MSCPDCFKGAVHDGKPRGKITKIHGLDTYVSEPADGRRIKGIVVIIPDAFGFPFVNNRLLADHYADKGDYRVYLPDFMAGWSCPIWMLGTLRRIENAETLFAKYITAPFLYLACFAVLIPWFAVNRIGASYPRVKTLFQCLRQDSATRDVPLGAAGFCWGGKHVALLAAEDSTQHGGRLLIDAGFTGHPSLLVLPTDVEKIKVPVSFAIGDRDSYVPLADIETIRKVVEGNPDPAQRGEVKVYENCSHGFCVRADIRFEEVARQATAAEDQCIEWFDRHFGIGG